MTPLVHVIEHHQWIREVRLMRAEARNAISTSLASDLAFVMGRIAADDGARVVLLTGDGPSFCVGADLKERAGFSEDQLAAQRPLFNDMFRSVREMPMPVIAQVHGHALGGGLELALSCDVIVAEPSALVGLPEVRVGLIPAGGGTQLLVRRIGRGRAADLILTGRHVTASQAHSLGIVDRLSAPGEVAADALALAEQIAGGSPAAVRAAKQAIRAAVPGLDDGLAVEEEQWRSVISGPDRTEGIRAFTEKRQPVWTVPEAGER
jgi:enoyl-CoA hydratase/carnithine racemase